MSKVIITGASGMIGKIVLNKCISSSAISTIISFVRKKSNQHSDKVLEIVLDDFNDYSGNEEHFKNVDAVFFCLGAYTGAVSNKKFKEITVDYTKAFVDVLRHYSPIANFCFLSGAGADRSEKSKIPFAKYKGMAENIIFNNLENSYTFHPAYIFPVEKRKESNVTYVLFRMFYPLIKILGNNFSVRSEELAEAMFVIGIQGAKYHTINNKEIVQIGKFK